IPWINILGHSEDADGLAAMSYSLNGGPWKNLSITPQQSARLARPGDFNVELEIDNIPSGANQLLIRAVDNQGNQAIRPATVINSSGPVWPLPYNIIWSQVAELTDTSQPIDGLWDLEP